MHATKTQTNLHKDEKHEKMRSNMKYSDTYVQQEKMRGWIIITMSSRIESNDRLAYTIKIFRGNPNVKGICTRTRFPFPG